MPLTGGIVRRTGVRAAAVAAPVIAAVTLVICFGGPDPDPPVDPRIWRMVRCIECFEGEQAAVVAMGDSAIPALRRFLLSGPHDTTLARQDSALSAPYSGSPVGPLVVPPPHLVDRRLDDFTASYRIRSSLALGLIGTDSARKTLCKGKAMQFRPDVNRFIDSALVLLNGSCP